MRIRLVLCLAAALALAACGQVDRSSPEASGDEERPSGERLADFLACARQVVYDYEPADAPAVLAREADVVVTGTMVAVSSALEVKVDQVVAGNEAVVSDGSVFVELPHFDHAACPTVPRADGILFLDDRGDARITATHVQGFLLEGADGKLVSVWESFEAMPPAWHGLDSVDEVLAELR